MPTDPVSLTPQQFVDLCRRHRRLLIVPAIAGALLAAVSTFVSPRKWNAEQGLLIRSDAAGYADQRLGKFTDLSEMKTVQETLLELARSQSVVTGVLAAVDGHEPSLQEVSDLRDDLRLTPPGGAEFGKTEVFYIGVLDPNRQRAIDLVNELTKQLDARLAKLRDERAGSMVAEVERSAAVARELLHHHVEQLAQFEQSVGADLIELRHLTSPNGGQSEFGQNALAIEADRRRIADRRRQNEALLTELQAAIDDPARIVATPDALLASQPGLRRLKNGLVDSQLTVARTAGVRTANHPYVQAARRAQQAIQAELVRELPTAIAGVKLELQVAGRRETELGEQIGGLRTRSAELASKRSRYAELVANVEGQTRVLEGALQQLADAKSHRAGVNTASLLAPIDGVETGVHPIGPSRKTVVAAGGLAGLLLGATLVFLLHVPATPAPTPVHSTPRVATPAASQPAPVEVGGAWAVERAEPAPWPSTGASVANVSPWDEAAATGASPTIGV